MVVAPCSADMLAKIANGLCDNLAVSQSHACRAYVQLSLLRALSPSTPVILCPAMNTHMYQHPFTAKHLAVVQEELGYLILGPQGTGKLACGDEGESACPQWRLDGCLTYDTGPGKMTDWREIVWNIQNMAAIFRYQTLGEPSTDPAKYPHPLGFDCCSRS